MILIIIGLSCVVFSQLFFNYYIAKIATMQKDKIEKLSHDLKVYEVERRVLANDIKLLKDLVRRVR
jgi:hypothetical protein